MGELKINHVTITPDGQAVLYLVDEPPAPPELVKERVEAVAAFALSGDLAAQIPKVAGRPVRSASSTSRRRRRR